MKRLAVLLGLLAFLLPGCDDGPTGTDRGPMAIRIGDPLDPDSRTFPEAVDEAIPGDTLLFVGGSRQTLSGTVTVQSSQTPLYFLPDLGSRQKSRGTIASDTETFPLLRFESPRPGTRVSFFAFEGGTIQIEVVGSGAIQVDSCEFRDGTVQLAARGPSVRAEHNLHLDPSEDGIQATSGSLVASNCTVVRAGGNGIAADGANAAIMNSIFYACETGIACANGGAFADTSGCNDVVDSGTGDYLGCGPFDEDFSDDPLFCDEPNGVYEIMSISLCSPANSGGCGLIGARPVACDPGVPSPTPPR